ncbi:DUF4037 domain-containing protein [Deinococcus koreensis]|uniref:DUF4037 domain-containing protein n=1 Tax=Deinococcus koreensis TaxID=2054903 RepID=A0A2K3UT81_9DEIO|nr:DUF4037 domain-containing protein [Deinococcus koreensis]PNY79737.1 DUF4037 domain-containing protein [Deinococcus koreensis]
MTTDDLPQALAHEYAAIEQVVAVVQGGSRTTGTQDARSDIDLYVYSREPVPLPARRAIARQYARRWEVGNTFTEEGDVLIERTTGTEIDVMFRPIASFEAHLHYLFDHHEARMGNSTTVWRNIRTSRILSDPEGWFARLQGQAARDYPDDLARAIIALNIPLLSGSIFSFSSQVILGVHRRDIVIVNGVLARLLDSYFDVLYALNRTHHPGNKRLLTLAAGLPLVPAGFVEGVERLLSFTLATLDEVPRHLDAVIEPLLQLIKAQGQLPEPWGEGQLE